MTLVLNKSQTGALILLLLFILLSISLYEAVFIIIFIHSFSPGGLGVFHNLCMVLAAAVVPAVITENFSLDMLQIDIIWEIMVCHFPASCSNCLTVFLERLNDRGLPDAV